MKTLKTLKCEIVLININGQKHSHFCKYASESIGSLYCYGFFISCTILHNNTNHVSEHNIINISYLYIFQISIGSNDIHKIKNCQ